MKCYIYCTKAKPYLWKYHCISDDYNGNSFETSYSKEEHDSTDDGEILNGQIVASFDLNKAEKMFIEYEKGWVTSSGLNINDIENKSKVSRSNLYKYKGNSKYLYAWHIENLEILDKPKDINSFWTRKVTDKWGITSKDMIMKAPQSWCYAELEGHNCIIISIKPEWVCKILNGEKTIEVRKTAPKELIK